jgi:hypothetical protein
MANVKYLHMTILYIKANMVVFVCLFVCLSLMNERTNERMTFLDDGGEGGL